MPDIALYDLAHARTGDKGNTINISLIAYREEDYPLLAEQVTPERECTPWLHVSNSGCCALYISTPVSACTQS